ncbi:MAG: tetratricopeptide repeat protein [Chloroflexota bacterium]
MDDIRAGIVGVKSDPRSNLVLGTGFFVAGGVVLTCAHVIEKYYQPGGKAAFCLKGPDAEFQATVTFFSPKSEYDLAILEPAGEVDYTPLPVASSQNSKGHSFSIFGYPNISFEGLNGAGTIMGWTREKGKRFPILQLDSRQITHGFSGAPVWDEDLQVVVGMLQQGITNEQIGRPSFALPIEVIQQAYPDLPVGLPTAPGGLPPGSYLPFPRNALFTGREKDLEKLQTALCSPGAGVRGSVVNQAISGMGGVGKTQLAVEFAYRYGSHFEGVHWLDLREPDALEAQIALCGGRMALQPWPHELPDQVALTLRAWQADGSRLLILDNFENVKEASPVLSRFQAANLCLLITSRRSDWPPALGLQPLPLDVFTPAESEEFLRKYLDEKFAKKELDELAGRLGHLPLALELAGRYFTLHPRLTIRGYLDKLEFALEHPSMRGFREDLPNPTRHDLDLLATFALSWEQAQDDASRTLFQAAGYCAPNETIPPEIFEQTLEVDETACDEAAQLLAGLGLLRENLSIHPLLAEFARRLDKQRVVLAKLVAALADIANQRNTAVDQSGNYALYTPLLPHVRSAAESAELAGIEQAGELWNSLGYHISDLADYAGAKLAYERALRIAETAFGPDHPNVARNVNNLGLVLQDLGDLAGARACFERALRIAETAFGPDHPTVATDVNNLGLVLQDLGDLAGARACFERALRIAETAFGPDHPTVAIRVNNLGLVLQDLGDLEGARACFERALRLFRQFLPAGHSNIKIVEGNLRGLGK